MGAIFIMLCKGGEGMAEIDSLEIQITASSRAAATAIDALNRKMRLVWKNWIKSTETT